MSSWVFRNHGARYPQPQRPGPGPGPGPGKPVVVIPGEPAGYDRFLFLGVRDDPAGAFDFAS